MAFTGKVVIVTGGASGIGAATVLEFAKAGAKVVVVDKNEAKLEEITEKCATIGTKLLAIKADLSNQEEGTTVIQKTIDELKKIDVLVNNAGVLALGSLVLGNLLESYDAVMGINLRAVVHLTSLVTPHIIETKGNIINISTVGGINSPINPMITAYCLSKAALTHFTRCAASELAPFGVRVNTISPGLVKTDLMNDIESDVSWEDLQKHTALDRIGEPAEVADLILYLASDKAKSITGSNYILDNGMSLR